MQRDYGDPVSKNITTENKKIRINLKFKKEKIYGEEIEHIF